MAHHGSDRKPTPGWVKVVFAAGAMVLVIVAGLIYGRMGSKQLETAIREARDRGEPATMDEVLAARRDWPDEANGALVFLEIRDAMQALKDVPEERRSVLLTGQGWSSQLGERWPAELQQDAARLLEEHAAELGVIDRLVAFEGARFDTPQPGMGAATGGPTQFAPLEALRMAMRLKAAQTVHRVNRGETSHVVEDLESLRALGELLTEEPSLISALVWVACDSYVIATLEWTCGLATLDDGQLARIDELLARIAGTRHLVLGLQGERASLLRMLAAARNPLSEGLVDRQRAAGFRAVTRLLDAARDPDGNFGVVKQVEAELDADSITQQVVASFTRSIELEVRLIAQARCARVAIAAERYRLKHGAWPEAPEALVPTFLAVLPTDPFIGQPLRYMPEDDRLLVYSVGDDGVDDGGAVSHVRTGPDIKDWGFILLIPERRGVEPSEPAPGNETSAN